MQSEIEKKIGKKAWRDTHIDYQVVAGRAPLG
jgi:tetrahydromethanopterin S-methyltransferase subunit G